MHVLNVVLLILSSPSRNSVSSVNKALMHTGVFQALSDLSVLHGSPVDTVFTTYHSILMWVL